MKFSELLSKLVADTCDVSLPLFGPELCIIGAIVGLLLVRLCNFERVLPASFVALAGAGAGLGISLLQFRQFGDAVAEQASTPLFTGLLMYDPFTVFFRVFLLLFLLFVVYLTILSGIPDKEDGPDFYVLLLGATLGMMLMASANHLLMVFLAVEMTSVPSYAMVGFLKGRKLSSEASLKYVVYGAGAAGVMLYGISLLAGLLGAANLTDMDHALLRFSEMHTEFSDPAVRALVLAVLMVLVGLAFKLSLVPFHFWCPDAFEGAAAEVGGFLSVASKAGAFGLLVRVCLALVGPPDHESTSLATVNLYLGVGLGIIAAVTATFGNLAAYSQKNMKRLLAYSTIAHAGYMLMAVAAMMVVLNGSEPPDAVVSRAEAARDCIEGLLYYLVVYFFMNLGAFAIVALIRNKIFSEDIADYAGLARQAPGLAVCMLLCLFSLVGLPPFGGFFGKFVIFASLYNAGFYHASMWVVLAIGGLNTVFSLVYYIRVLKVMFIGSATDDARTIDFSMASNAGRYVLLVSVPVLLLGVLVNPVSQIARQVAKQLF